MPAYWTPPTLTTMRSWLKRQYPGGAFGKMKYTQLYAIYKQRINQLKEVSQNDHSTTYQHDHRIDD